MKLVILLLAFLLGKAYGFPERYVRNAGSGGSSEEKKKPHIVFFLADNAGWNDVGWNDLTGVMKTPNMDALARSGVILNQTYVQPICTPTRAAFLTGYYAFRTGLGHAVIPPAMPSYLSREFKVLPEYLKELGYTNHILGKWHLGACRWDVTPRWRGFDTHYGPQGGFCDYYNHSVSTHQVINQLFGLYSGPMALDFRDNTGAMFHHKGTHASELIEKRAIDLIANHNPDVPMFLYMAFAVPHSPYQVPDRYTNMYEPTPVNNLQKYRGMVTMMDQHIGNITNALKANDMYEDTVIVYLNDNGGVGRFGSSWPYRGALATPFEGGVKAPGFVHSPLLEKTGYVNNELIHITDFFATFLTLAGGTPDPSIDGMNVWDVISKNKKSTRNTMILHLDTHPVSPCISILDDGYKLIKGFYDAARNLSSLYDLIRTDDWIPPPELSDTADIPDVPEEPKNTTMLFDLSVDPLETNNLAESMPEKVAELLQLAEEIAAGAPDPFFPLEIPDVSDPIAFYNNTWTPGWC
ncbi:arylsulfatase B-like [Ptychodera flava]|uniref:arylsulfatase B-like n=1 Tax=Ptychodera flava TaxID=63121 RepID=UPI00396A267C